MMDKVNPRGATFAPNLIERCLMARKTAVKSRPAPEPEEDDEDELVVEDEDEELTELDEDEESETPTKKKSNRGSRDDEVTFGARHLSEHLTKITGKTVTPRDLRVLLRKMARSGQLEREVSQGNRTRYDWPKGLEDPEVKRIVKAVKSGEIEKGKKEALDALKAKKAASDATKAKSKKGDKTKTKSKAPVEEEFEDEDFEDEDED